MPTINVKSTDSGLQSSIADYLERKLEPLKKFLRDENDIHVEMDYSRDKSGLKYHVEITINPKSEVFASARGGDFHEAIDLCVPKIKEQLEKQKDKKISLRKKLGAERKGR